VIKWALSRRKRPDAGGFAQPLTPSPVPQDPAPSSLTFTWIGHSTFLIRSGGISILTDPIWSDRASPVQFAGPRRHVPPGLSLEKLPLIDVVFISHDHYDHLDDHTVRLFVGRFPGTHWITPLGVGRFLRKRGASRVTELDWWERADVGNISAFCTPAKHFSGRYPWNRNSTLWSGWVIGFGNRRVFFAGDTAFHPDFADIARRFGPFDAAILPIGAYEPSWFMQAVHMSPEEAVAAYCEIASTLDASTCAFIPSHWGTFRLTDEPLAEPPERLREAWSKASLHQSHLRLISQGETTQCD
jgi:N-acyl-phosphatidylethanolamine-hydrolysing phospholipase D